MNDDDHHTKNNGTLLNQQLKGLKNEHVLNNLLENN